MLPESTVSVPISVERQAALRAIRLTNEAAERPPYAWARLTTEDLLWLMQEHGWATGDAPGPRVDLREAHLAGVNLAGWALRFARFEGASLFQADLRGTDLFYAQLTDADLREVQGEGAHLTLARMGGARLQGAHLRGAHMAQCWLPEADLSGALLDGANLTSAQMERVDLHEASLVGAQLTWAKLPEADLRAANAAGADLRSAHLEKAQLDSVNLTGARLEGAWCDNAACYAAQMTGVDLRGARLNGAQLAGATLAGARWAGCDLTQVDLARVGDLAALVTQPTGDALAARAGAGSAAERAVAWQNAADAAARLQIALVRDPAIDPALIRQLHQQVGRLRRTAQRVQAGTSLSALVAWLRAAFAYLFVGEGDAPGRVALWAAGLVVVMTALTLALPRLTDAHDLLGALSLALSGLTTPGYSFFASHTSGALQGLGVLESLVGDVLLACFIAAVVRKGR